MRSLLFHHSPKMTRSCMYWALIFTPLYTSLAISLPSSLIHHKNKSLNKDRTNQRSLRTLLSNHSPLSLFHSGIKATIQWAVSWWTGKNSARAFLCIWQKLGYSEKGSCIECIAKCHSAVRCRRVLSCLHWSKGQSQGQISQHTGDSYNLGMVNTGLRG